MKKLLLTGLAVFALSTVAHAELSGTVALDYSAYKPKVFDEKVDLSGVGLSISTPTENKHGFYTKFQYLKNGELNTDLVGVDFGYQHNFYNQNRIYALGKIGFGYAGVTVDAYSNSNHFFTIPVSAEVGYQVLPNVSTYATAGYQWASDTTSQTTCRDGSQSNSTGQGTCSWHGGIAYYNDKIGNVNGLTFGAGARYHF